MDSQIEIGDDSSDPDNIFNSSSQIEEPVNDKFRLQYNIDFCKSLFPSFEFNNYFSSIITLQIPGSILPKSILHVNDFDRSPILCEISIETNNSWTEKPSLVSITNPIHTNNFIGKILIHKRIISFFSEDYNPSPFYRSQNYIITPPGRIDDDNYAKLLNRGFECEESKRALLFMNNNLD